MNEVKYNTTQPTDDMIAERAYAIWQSRGCPEGDGTTDWELAREQLLSELRSGSSRGPLRWLISRLRSRAA